MNCVQLNCLAKPFNDPNVRRAAAMADQPAASTPR